MSVDTKMSLRIFLCLANPRELRPQEVPLRQGGEVEAWMLNAV